MPKPLIETIRLPYPVPYHAQIVSLELAESIFVNGLDPINDPRWAESGAKTPKEYAYWVERACGVACLKMCVEAAGGPTRSLIDWARLGLRRDCYLIRTNSDGTKQEVGWVHAALAELAKDDGLEAKACPANLDEIIIQLRQGNMVIASISYEAGDDRLPITQQGGHLVVVIGADCIDHHPNAFIINNPSGRKAELQAGASLSQTRFAAGYSGRIIVIGRA